MALRVRTALLSALLTLPAWPLQAQQPAPFLFGYGAQRPYAGYGYRGSSSQRGFDEAETYRQSGTVRTLCVRLCDGYYFPISHAVPRSSLGRDDDACNASCGSGARLFYHPTSGGDVETMVDLDGMGYSTLPTAFKYRKSLVAGCACRPQPWSEVERRRHRGYGDGDQPAEAEAHPGGVEAPHAGASGDERAVARPQPVARHVDPAPLWPGRSRAAPKPQFVWPGGRD